MNSDGFPIGLEARWIVYFFFFLVFFLAAFFLTRDRGFSGRGTVSIALGDVFFFFLFATFFFAISYTSMLNKKLSMGWLTRRSHADLLYFDCSEKGFQQKNKIFFNKMMK